MDKAEPSPNFSSQDDCIRYLESIRWQGNPTCPYCNVQKSTPLKDGRHHCNGCGTAFSVTVRTIFHDTRLPLPKWFLAIKIVVNSHGRISARQLAKRIQINKNTAWLLINKIYGAMAITNERQLLLGIVAMQEE
jgi:transposase-like protein